MRYYSICLLAYAKAIFVVPMKAQSHYGSDSLGAIWGMGGSPGELSEELVA